MIRAADAALGEGARVVLVEEDPGLLARVEEALHDADSATAPPRILHGRWSPARSC